MTWSVDCVDCVIIYNYSFPDSFIEISLLFLFFLLLISS